MDNHTVEPNKVVINKNNFSIYRDESLCKNCGLCKFVCNKDIGVDGYYNKAMDNSVCINCGQCVQRCPFNALNIVSSIQLVKDALSDSSKTVIFTVSPAVRVAFGEFYGLKPGINVERKIVGILKKLGAKFVLDTTFGADLTVIEEACELVERLNNNGDLPLFTSCCPSWVDFVEMFIPKYIKNLSSTRSPIAMQGAIIKTFFANKNEIDPKNIFTVAVTPCTAKKTEFRRNDMNKSGQFLSNLKIKDIDAVITTTELYQLAKEQEIKFEEIDELPFDQLMGKGSGAGILFGGSGGVMEAVLRTAYFIINN